MFNCQAAILQRNGQCQRLGPQLGDLHVARSQNRNVRFTDSQHQIWYALSHDGERVDFEPVGIDHDVIQPDHAACGSQQNAGAGAGDHFAQNDVGEGAGYGGKSGNSQGIADSATANCDHVSVDCARCGNVECPIGGVGDQPHALQVGDLNITGCGDNGRDIFGSGPGGDTRR